VDRDEVNVHSLSALHAKVVVVDGKMPVAVVGSANASANSRDTLFEAALVTDDEEAIEDARAQVTAWILAAGDPLDETWVERADIIYREPRLLPKPPPEIDRPTRLWVCTFEYADYPVTSSPTARAAASALRKLSPQRKTLQPWEMLPGDEGVVLAGDIVVLVQRKPGKEPTSRSEVWAPAQVAHVDPGKNGRGPVAALLRESGARRVRFGDLAEAFTAEGVTLELNWMLYEDSELIDRVTALF
jgi:hypothetical protein